jgi:hypothetical protein
LGGEGRFTFFFFLVNKQRWCLYLLLCQCWLRAYICVDGLGRACAPYFFTKKYFGSCRKSNWLGMIPVESRPVLIWDFFFFFTVGERVGKWLHNWERLRMPELGNWWIVLLL